MLLCSLKCSIIDSYPVYITELIVKLMTRKFSQVKISKVFKNDVQIRHKVFYI